jgi:hypothetical protein
MKKPTRGAFHVLVAVSLLCSGTAAGQMLLVDQARRAEGLWCFPQADNPHVWKYLPAEARLATDANKKPEFSFIRYAKAVATSDSAPETITEAAGGGVLHLLALYETDPRQVARAQSQLRRDLNDDALKLDGPVIFNSGRYAVISSVLPAAATPASDSSPVRKLLDAGSAPVLEGNKIALSFDLDKTQSMLLAQSLRMAKPDVSITFDMEFGGLANAYDATVDVDWARVQKSEKVAAGIKIYYIGADVKVAVEDLVRTEAIKVTSRGESSTMEGLLNAAYSKIVDLLFQPVPGSAPPPQPGILDSLLGGGGSGGQSASPFSLYGSYELKDLHSSGHTTISLNHQGAVRRHTLLTMNIGELFAKYGSDPAYFRVVNLSDPMFRTRRIVVSVDGSLLPEFEKFVNYVTVTMRKQHEDGNVSGGEAVIDAKRAAKAFADTGDGRIAFEYPSRGDDDFERWLQYEYRTRWNFRGGASYTSDWVKTDAPMISVFAPYERRTIHLVGEPAALKARGVLYVVARVSYSFFGSEKTQQVIWRLKEPIDAAVDVTLPANQFTTKVTTSWFFPNDKSTTITREDSSGVVLLDEFPNP